VRAFDVGFWALPLPAPGLDALVFSLVCWLFYEPLCKLLSRGTSLNSDMTVIRGAWMGQMARREIRLMDANLLGHALNSASFFASSNLLLIAASAGALFGGESTFASVSSLEVIRTSTRFLFEGQLALIHHVAANRAADDRAERGEEHHAGENREPARVGVDANGVELGVWRAEFRKRAVLLSGSPGRKKSSQAKTGRGR